MFYRYDPRNNKWESRSSLTIGRCKHTAAGIGVYIYVSGRTTRTVYLLRRSVTISSCKMFQYTFSVVFSITQWYHFVNRLPVKIKSNTNAFCDKISSELIASSHGKFQKNCVTFKC